MAMPIYEFRCEVCEARFEGLVPAGTESIACPQCGAERTVRLLSTPGAPPRLVKSSGAKRQQEIRNARLHADTKARFKEARRKARETKNKPGGGSDGSAGAA